MKPSSSSFRDNHVCKDQHITVFADTRLTNSKEIARLTGSDVSSSQCELILHAYKKWQQDCVGFLQGDFANLGMGGVLNDAIIGVIQFRDMRGNHLPLATGKRARAAHHLVGVSQQGGRIAREGGQYVTQRGICDDGRKAPSCYC